MGKIKNFYSKYLHNTLGFCAVLAFLLNLVIESLARQSAIGGLGFLFSSPAVFLFNVLIIFATLSISILFRRRIFVISIISIFWLAIGVVNGIILSQRMTPFTTDDVLALKEGFEMAVNYLSLKQIVLYLGGAIFLFGGLVILFIKAPKKKERVNFRRSIAAIVVIGICLTVTAFLGVRSGTLATFFPNLAYGYRDNGVPYCFINTWLNKGVNKPAGYSKEQIDGIFTEKEKAALRGGENKGTTTDDDVNIIFVQLESVVEPYAIKGIEYSKDPTPNCRKFMEEYSSGKLEVPTMGAGTANTEFELITGLRAKFFGPGEYPYKTILSKEVSESYPFVLSELGYKSHAIHNHRGVFYGRNEVFANLGFDTFTSLEYMSNSIKTEKNWAKDSVLTEQIMDALNSSEEKDYIYTISVQGHGRYPTEKVLENPEITVNTKLSDEIKYQYEYYANQIYESDKFIGELISEMSKYDEKVVVIGFGDHLPAIENISDENLIGRNMYETDYFIWANYPMEKKEKDLKSYQLGAEVLNRLGIHEGTMTTYHQNYIGKDNYQKNLKALQYDMLYGKKYIYDGKLPFERKKMRMGIKDIKVEAVAKIGEKYYIKGQNFTEFSKINLDGKILKTIYLGPNMLGLLEEVDEDAASRMKISQVEKGKEILSTTE